MTHLEYITALVEQLDKLDQRQVSAPSDQGQTADQALERAIERIIRKRASL